MPHGYTSIPPEATICLCQQRLRKGELQAGRKSGLSHHPKFRTAQVQQPHQKSILVATAATMRSILSTSRGLGFFILALLEYAGLMQSVVFLLHHPMEVSHHERHWHRVEDTQHLAEVLLALCITCPPTDEGQPSAPLSAGNVHTGIHLHLPCSSSVCLTRSVAVERNELGQAYTTNKSPGQFALRNMTLHFAFMKGLTVWARRGLW